MLKRDKKNKIKNLVLGNRASAKQMSYLILGLYDLPKKKVKPFMTTCVIL